MSSLDRPLEEVREFFRARRSQEPRPSPEPTKTAKDGRTLKDLVEELQGMTAGYKLRFLVALVPDPVESYVGTEFDTYVGGLVRGATTAGWLRDRHWFPWQRQTPASGSKDPLEPTGGRHTRSPGILLFRNEKTSTLLCVFLVGESPVTGIQKTPFTSVLRFIAAIPETLLRREDGAPVEIQVLGPFSSGSADSCGKALGTLCRTTEGPLGDVRFMSGSATGPRLLPVLSPRSSHCAGRLRVKFNRSVVADDLLMRGAFDFFEKILHWHPDEIAVVTELGTSYGNSVASITNLETRPRWRLHLQLPGALWSVRTASEHARKVGELEVAGVKVPRTALDLKLDETRTPSDAFPDFNSLTAPLAELSIDSLLATLSRERIRHLGLVFTDVRDKLFMADKIRKYAPHVSLFTFESSLLYLHPRFNAATDGMIVVSSYSLSMLTQQLMGRGGGEESRRTQFGSDAEQGVYNAAVLLLTSPNEDPLIVNYLTAHGTNFRAPAVWISAVGDRRIVPVAAYRPYGPEIPTDVAIARAVAELRSIRSGAVPDPYPERVSLVDRLRISAGFRFCFLLATVAFLLLGFGFALGSSPSRGRRWLPGFFPPLSGPDAEHGQRLAWVVSLLALASVVWMALAAVYLFPFILRNRFGITPSASIHPGDPWYAPFLHGERFIEWEELVMGFVARNLFVEFALLVLALGWLGLRVAATRSLRARIVSAAVLAACALCALLAARFAMRDALPGASAEFEHAVFTFLRIASGAASLSPLTGIIFLSLGVGCLLVFQLRRLRIQDLAPSLVPGEWEAPGRRPALGGVGGLKLRLDERIRQAFPRSPWFVLVLLALLAPFLLTFLLRFEASCDSIIWARSFALLFVLLLVLSLAAFYRFASLWHSLQLLTDRLEASRIADGLERHREELGWYALRPWGARREDDDSTLARSVEDLRRLARTLVLPGSSVSLRDLSSTANANLAEVFAAAARGDVVAERTARLEVLKSLDAAVEATEPLRYDPGSEGWPGDDRRRDAIRGFLALRVVAFIRYVFAEIRNSLLAFTGGILFLLVALGTFHFQPIRSIYVVLWSTIGVMAVWTVAVFMQMDRNSLVSRIGGTKPGEINPLQSGFLLRTATFVLPPILILILTQFPQLGDPLMNWISPLLRFFQ